MTATGFYEQKTIRPGGMALVIALHAAAFAGLVMIKTDIIHAGDPITEVFNVTPPPTPKQEPPPEPRQQPPRQQSSLDAPRPIIPTPHDDGPVVTERIAPQPTYFPPARETVLADATPDLPRLPVRVEAQVDPRFARQLQPPYPPAEESRQRDGTVRVRVTIGADGRVKAIARISATSDAFWNATERHALSRWRFRPATEDGRPVESTKVMNVIFRIEA
jgi:periplasmic protein TonB